MLQEYGTLKNTNSLLLQTTVTSNKYRNEHIYLD